MSHGIKILTPAHGMGLTNSHFCLRFPRDSALDDPDSTLRNSRQEIRVLGLVVQPPVLIQMGETGDLLGEDEIGSEQQLP